MGLDIFLVFGIQLFVIISAIILLVKIPPMNSFYGYRTKMSSINDEYWKYANKIAAKTIIVISALSILVGMPTDNNTNVAKMPVFQCFYEKCSLVVHTVQPRSPFPKII